MHIRLDLVFVIQGHIIDVSPKEGGYVCINVVVGKRNLHKIKVKKT